MPPHTFSPHRLPHRWCRLAVVIPLVIGLLETVQAQLVFSASAGGGPGFGLFERRNGQTVRLTTGQNDHFFPWVSRNGQLISFSAPDPTVVGANPSSDVYVYNRVNGQTLRVINNETFADGVGGNIAVRAVSSAVSPDASLMAYGVAFQANAGVGANASGKGLRVVRLSNGLDAGQQVALGATTPSDSLQAEFIGISWDPQGASFVTPTYVLLGSFGGFPQSLPAIVRWTLQGNGSWTPSQLTAPQFSNNFTAARFHIYPAISPSGAGLAYFSVFFPSLTSTSTPAQISLVRANADGSNPTILATFTPTQQQTFYPAGLDWSPDGTRLVFSIGSQANNGLGLTAAVDLTTARTFSVRSGDGGDLQPVAGLESGAFPSFGPSDGASGSLNGARLSLVPTGPGTFQLSATGLDPAAIYELSSSATLAAGSFGAPQSFTGSQLMAGIPVNSGGPRRFFRLSTP